MDSWMGRSNDPVTLHKYAYANLDPVNGIDPSGQFTVSGLMQSTGVQAILVNTAIATPFAALDTLLTYREGGNLGASIKSGLTTLSIGAIAGAGLQGILRNAPAIIKVTSGSIAAIRGGRAAGSVWNLAPSARGFAMEPIVLGRAPSIAVRNFPVIDDFSNGVATSIKSLDLTASSYRTNPSRIVSRLRGYARSLQSFRGATHGGTTVRGSAIKDKVLLVAFENGALTTQQARLLTPFIKQFKNEYPDLNLVIQWIK